MAERGDKGLGAMEVAAVAVIGIFAVVVIFWIFGWLAGMAWWILKIATLAAILGLLVRWAFRRTTR